MMHDSADLPLTSQSSCIGIFAHEIPFTSSHKLEYLETGVNEALRRPTTPTITRRGASSCLVNRFYVCRFGKLPLEISSYIFKILSKMDEVDRVSYFFNGVRKMTVAPLLLGAVCSEWRTIAWSIPRLWSTITIDLRLFLRNKNPAETLKQWIDRTGVLPLTINLYFRGPVTLENAMSTSQLEEQAQAFIETINSFSSRFETLSLDLPFHWTCLLNRVNGTQAPILRHLTVNGRFEFGALETPLFVNSGVMYAPTHLYLSQDLGVHSLGINWTSLTHFYAMDMPVQDLFEVIGRAPSLISFTSRNSILEEHSRGPLPSTVVMHSGLRSLELFHSTRHDTGVDIILDHLNLPSLEDFRYQGSFMNPVNMSISSLIAMIERSSCRLRSLELEEPGFAPDELIRLLEATPALERLVIELPGHKKTPSCLYQALSKSQLNRTEFSLLPNLKSLQLK